MPRDRPSPDSRVLLACRAALAYQDRHIDMAHVETARQWPAMAAALEDC